MAGFHRDVSCFFFCFWAWRATLGTQKKYGISGILMGISGISSEIGMMGLEYCWDLVDFYCQDDHRIISVATNFAGRRQLCAELSRLW